MTWPAWVLVAVDALIITVAILDIGKERELSVMTRARFLWVSVAVLLHAMLVVRLGTS